MAQRGYGGRCKPYVLSFRQAPVGVKEREATVQQTSAGATFETPLAMPLPPAGPPSTAMGFNGVHWNVAGAPVSSAGKRLGAYFLDGLLVLVTLIIGWLIWSLVVWGKGQTPGKALLGMRCVKKDTGRVATFGTMALRELVGKGLLGSVTFGITNLVSCFMVLGAEHSSVWDKVAGTVVVDDPQGRLL